MKDYLKQFQFPEDLKEMDYDELELLSYEIRDFLIAVSILRRTRSSGM